MTQSKQKTCQNCKASFVIDAQDFDFYEKIQVPPPTFCPECRFQRRLLWRNEKTLYKKQCGLCKRNIVTIYSPDNPFKVYCNECYHGDKWDPLSYGLELDLSRSFLEQFQDLQSKVPRIYAFVFKNFDSEYTNGTAFNKNCYLIFVSDHNEDSLYSYAINNSKNTVDCYGSNECELCYESVNCKKCYQVFYSQDCFSSQSLYFCKDCVNCQNCIGSVNLRNKKYYIFNEPYSKEDYLKKLNELNFDLYNGIQKFKEKVYESENHYLAKYIHGLHNVKVSGDYINDSKNSFHVYNSEALEDCKFINHGHKALDCNDGYVVVDNSQFSYEVVSAITLNNVKFGYCVWNGNDIIYCDSCENSNNLFGCISLRKKSYCILNKQYTKEEYNELVPKIIEHMNLRPYTDKKGRIYKYGEFFPSELSPFAYNETVAQEYFPLTKEQALEQGYTWKDIEKKDYSITLKPNDLPNNIKDINDDILNQVIGCEHEGKCNEQCTTAFKIIPQELQFYQSMNIPLPRLCPNCRHHQRLKQRNPLKLWHRQCMCDDSTSSLQTSSGQVTYTNTASHFHGKDHCPNEFETSYAPERKEIVYCEQCYNSEIV